MKAAGPAIGPAASATFSGEPGDSRVRRRRSEGFAPLGREGRRLKLPAARGSFTMHSSHFWQSAALIGIIVGAAVLSVMMSVGVHAEPASAYLLAEIPVSR